MVGSRHQACDGADIVSKQRPVVTHSRLLEILDYDQITGQFTWKIRLGGPVKVGSIAGNDIAVRKPSVTRCGCTYRQIRIEGRNYYAHVLARFYVTGEWPPRLVDHRDGNGLNNAYSNLRDSTAAQNNQNRVKASKNSSTGLLGARREGAKYLAAIRINGKVVRLGRFNTAEAAHQAYIAAKRIHHPFSRFDA